jgi:hypothetical protein
VSLGLLVPGVTPWNSTLAPETGANNPGLRLFQYDLDTGRIVDYHQFFLNLTKVIIDSFWSFGNQIGDISRRQVTLQQPIRALGVENFYTRTIQGVTKRSVLADQ